MTIFNRSGTLVIQFEGQGFVLAPTATEPNRPSLADKRPTPKRPTPKPSRTLTENIALAKDLRSLGEGCNSISSLSRNSDAEAALAKVLKEIAGQV